MTPQDLEQIEGRYELQYLYDGGSCLRQDDVQALIAEVHRLWKINEHLIALNRQALARLDKANPTWQDTRDHLNSLSDGSQP